MSRRSVWMFVVMLVIIVAPLLVVTVAQAWTVPGQVQCNLCYQWYQAGNHWNHGEQGHNDHSLIGYIPGLTCGNCGWRVVQPYHMRCQITRTTYAGLTDLGPPVTGPCYAPVCPTMPSYAGSRCEAHRDPCLTCSWANWLHTAHCQHHIPGTPMGQLCGKPVCPSHYTWDNRIYWSPGHYCIHCRSCEAVCTATYPHHCSICGEPGWWLGPPQFPVVHNGDLVYYWCNTYHSSGSTCGANETIPVGHMLLYAWYDQFFVLYEDPHIID